MISNFSYIIENKLAGCAHPAAMGRPDRALRDLADKGISAVLSLDETGLVSPTLAELGMDHLHVPIPDFEPPTIAQAESSIRFIESKIQEGKPVAVHCRAGIGRTGTILACYLVVMGYAPDAAIRYVRQLRPGSIETSDQERFVAQYYAYVSSRRA